MFFTIKNDKIDSPLSFTARLLKADGQSVCFFSRDRVCSDFFLITRVVGYYYIEEQVLKGSLAHVIFWFQLVCPKEPVEASN
jgi:hypothetical protein